jgi:hypothetical protein
MRRFYLAFPRRIPQIAQTASGQIEMIAHHPDFGEDRAAKTDDRARINGEGFADSTIIGKSVLPTQI